MSKILHTAFYNPLQVEGFDSKSLPEKISLFDAEMALAYERFKKNDNQILTSCNYSDVELKNATIILSILS